MPKGKQKVFATPKKKQTKNQPPETADEFLETGVQFEEAGEKWRGGDAAKSLRFFVRAIENYDEGLRRFPDSFDIAYNKARVQYDITQRPALYKQLPHSLVNLLSEALQVHRLALSLDPHNADVMFNTAQVLASTADVIEGNDELSMGYLEEALNLFEQCMTAQERLYAQSQDFHMRDAEDDDAQDQDGGVELDAGHTSTSETPDVAAAESMQWASIIEPTTSSSLVETCIAALEALTALSSLLPGGNDVALDQLAKYSQNWTSKTNEHIAGLEEGKLRDEVRCAMYKFQAASTEAEFRFGRVTSSAYSRRVNELSETLIAGADVSWAALCCCADANIAFTAVTSGSPGTANTRWAKLTKALDYLSQATLVAGPQDLASIHIGRGDVELFRFSLCLEGQLPENVSNPTVRARLLKNAETYYRRAGAVALSTSGQQELAAAAVIKEALAQSLSEENPNAVLQLDRPGIGAAEIRKTLRDLVEESIVSESTLGACGFDQVLGKQAGES